MSAESIRFASIRSIAALFDVSHSTAWRWDCGASGPSSLKVLQVSRLTGLPSDQLLEALESRQKDAIIAAQADKDLQLLMAGQEYAEAV